MLSKKTIAIIGGGASALSLASFLDGDLFDVTLYERNKAMGRKFLVAGKGGFNLTHSESIDGLISKYNPRGFLDGALLGFNNDQFRTWLDSIGIPTYVGSSRRVFPEKGIKPIEVLAKIKEVIRARGHNVIFNSEWTGWSDKNMLTLSDGGEIEADIVVFCLGGGSWKVTGSDGTWSEAFRLKGIQANPFVAANCAYGVNWDLDFISKAAGKPLKNISVSCLDKREVGEAMITEFGLEGSAVYALTDQIQKQLTDNGTSRIEMDLKPMLTLDEVIKRLSSSKRKITDALIKDLKLEKIKVQLLKSVLSKDEYLDTDSLAKNIKALPVNLEYATDIDQAISTTGGIDLSEVDANFQLNKMPDNYTIGEMLDWNAPTGGYLLQACFSMGHHLATHLNKKY